MIDGPRPHLLHGLLFQDITVTRKEVIAWPGGRMTEDTRTLHGHAACHYWLTKTIIDSSLQLHFRPYQLTQLKG